MATDGPSDDRGMLGVQAWKRPGDRRVCTSSLRGKAANGGVALFRALQGREGGHFRDRLQRREAADGSSSGDPQASGS